MRLYLEYISILLRSQLAHRTSFILLSVAQFFVPFSVFISFTMLFDRFGEIQGFTFFEMAMCYGVVHCSFSLAEAFIRGFDSFSVLIREAEFDRLMVRPRNLVLQVLGTNFEFTRIGRLAQSLIVLSIAINGLSLDWPLWKILLLVMMILSGMVIFSAIFILASTLCFWTVEGTELANLFTDGGRELNQFPLSIYHKSFRQFFTFVVPFGMANYYPLMLVLNREAFSWHYFLAPIYPVLLLVLAIRIWYMGVSKYQSSGS